jgi:hypothetical protein
VDVLSFVDIGYFVNMFERRQLIIDILLWFGVGDVFVLNSKYLFAVVCVLDANIFDGMRF